MIDPRSFSNPMQLGGYQIQQQQVPIKRTRLGSEHVHWSLLDSEGGWVVAMFCGIEQRLKGPVTVRYDHPHGAGDEHYRLQRDRIVAKGCTLRTLNMVDFWDHWGRRTAEYERYGKDDLFRVR